MKILVVDDEPVIADTLVDILTGEGYEAFAVSDGEAALRWTEMLLPDAVITDVIMPGMDGVEVARRIVQMLPTAGYSCFQARPPAPRWWKTPARKATRLKCRPSPSIRKPCWKNSRAYFFFCSSFRSHNQG